MSKRDYYETLGVSREADEKALKSAFRKKAMQYHPDRNPGDADAEKSFKEVNEAYEMLKDDQKRAAYDRYGHAAFENGGGAGGGARGFDGDFASTMSDIFDEFFGGRSPGGGGRRGGRSGAEPGSDLRYNLEIDLEEAFEGKTVEIQVPANAECESCDGSGAAPGSKPSACRTCGGAGRVRASQGFFTLEQTCPTCEGRGEVITNPCSSCSGSGVTRRERTLSINVPAGIEDGTRIRLSAEGDSGRRGGQPGDLYIFVNIRPHDFFQRDGADLFCQAPISIVTAALGGQFEVPTIDSGKTRVKVPEGTQGGRQFRLRGKGMPVMRTRQTGDLYIQVTVETPQNLSARQRELLREFDDISTDDNSPQTEGFFSKVKDFFGSQDN